MSLSSYNHLPQPPKHSSRREGIRLRLGTLLLILLCVDAVLSWLHWVPTARPWNALFTGLTTLLVLVLYPYEQNASPFRRFVSAVVVTVLAAWTVLDLVFPALSLLDDLLAWVLVILSLVAFALRQVVPTKNPEQRDDSDTSR